MLAVSKEIVLQINMKHIDEKTKKNKKQDSYV